MMPETVAQAARHDSAVVGPRYAVFPVHGGFDIVASTVLLALDDNSRGQRAGVFDLGHQQIPFGTQPVLVGPATVYGMVGVEYLLRTWPTAVAKPWLVLADDVPARLPPTAAFRLRALRGRLAGTSRLPYLAVLRTVEGPEDAFAHRSVQRAATKLRRELEGKS